VVGEEIGSGLGEGAETPGPVVGALVLEIDGLGAGDRAVGDVADDAEGLGDRDRSVGDVADDAEGLSNREGFVAGVSGTKSKDWRLCAGGRSLAALATASFTRVGLAAYVTTDRVFCATAFSAVCCSGLTPTPM
jgi:hypothetical protein